jgi:hypothetical protein
VGGGIKKSGKKWCSYYLNHEQDTWFHVSLNSLYISEHAHVVSLLYDIPP